MEITTQQQPQHYKASVLVIEDEKFISDLYRRALEKAGYQVGLAQDGEQALHEASRNIYDIILLDIMLPNLNGIDILYTLKDQNVQPPLKSKVIITTNLDQGEENRAKIENLADGYLIKAEITPKVLVQFVDQVLTTIQP